MAARALAVTLAQKRRFYWEILIVLALSLGKSGVYALVKLIDISTRGPISDATASLNTPQNQRESFDLIYQLLDNFFALAPVALVIYLLWQPTVSGFQRVGLNFARPWRDLSLAVLLFILIGVGTLGVYQAGRALGITAAISPNNLAETWWTVPMLLIAAFRNGIVEETIIIGYLMIRLEQLGWKLWPIILLSAGIRGSYHLYQGIGPFLGNVAMGVIFAWVFSRYRRVMPLVIAHGLLNSTAFLFGSSLGFN